MLRKKERVGRSQKCIEGLYKAELVENHLENQEEIDEDERGDPILKSEFDRALKDLDLQKSVEVDEISPELFSSTGQVSWLLKLICKI